MAVAIFKPVLADFWDNFHFPDNSRLVNIPLKGMKRGIASLTFAIIGQHVNSETILHTATHLFHYELFVGT